MHVGLAKPQSSLQSADIEGAQPQCVKFKSNRLGVDPLNPTYKLQSVTYVAPEPNRFIRD